jgi:hypothetical protein
VEQAALTSELPFHGWKSDGVPPISISASVATFQSRNADAQLRLLRLPKKGSFKTTVTPFSRSGWSVVRNASLAKGGTSKERPSPNLHKVPTWSNKASPRTFQTPSYKEQLTQAVSGLSAILLPFLREVSLISFCKRVSCCSNFLTK